jgi:UDP-glucuronate 4-epimerase
LLLRFTSSLRGSKEASLCRSSGRPGQDYTYVDDIVAGIVAAIDYTPRSVDGAPFAVFNLGNSRPVKLTELVELLSA